MNAKTVKKLLMKGRVKSFWGRRAYLTVRIPTKALTSNPRPEPLSFPGLTPSDLFEGEWSNEDGSETVSITKLTTGTDPRGNSAEPIFFPTQGPKGDSWEVWEYWKASHTKDGVTKPLTEAQVAQYRALQEWYDSLHRFHLSPLLGLFQNAANWAKSTEWYTDESGEVTFALFGVKWFYPSRKLGFSSNLSRAVKAAKAANVPVRVF